MYKNPGTTKLQLFEFLLNFLDLIKNQAISTRASAKQQAKLYLFKKSSLLIQYV